MLRKGQKGSPLETSNDASVLDVSVELTDVYVKTSALGETKSDPIYTERHANREVSKSSPPIPIICPKPVAFRAKGFFLSLGAMIIAWAVAVLLSGVMCVLMIYKSRVIH
jgi:hypothetical protein